MTDTAVIFDIIGRDKTSAAIAASGTAFNKFAIGLAAGAAFAGAKFVDMAGNFQQGMTRLKTGAGEVDSNMGLVSQGILDMAGQVGESTHDLLAGMYLIESAGFHGADGLNVLKVAAQGAKVGNADMATVADAVTTALNAYHMSADQAAQATNALIAAEGQGKTNLEALSGSLSTVAPIAAVAHVSLNEVLGAMATMTGQGTDAASAATYLKQTIGQLSNPTQKASLEMRGLGLDSVAVSQNLGKNGLASTLQMLTDAIQNKMGPAGTVLIQHLQKVAGNTTEFQKVLANLPPTQQTYIGALANMVGGTKSMQAALELTGGNMETFQHNTDVINEKVKAGGSSIEGWSDVQKNFNQRMAEAKGTVEALGIKIGMALLPAAQQMLNSTMSAVEWFTKHKTVARDLGIAIGIAAGAFIAYRIAVVAIEIGTKAWMVATKAAAAAQWLLNLAMDANPIGVVIVIIGVLIAVFVLLWTHSAGFRNFFIGMWKDIWGFLKGVGEWFAGPFAHFFIDAWNVIWGAAKAVGAWFAGPFTNFFVDVGKAIAAPFLWLWHNILDPFWQIFSKGFMTIMRIITSFRNLFIDLAVKGIQMIWDGVLKPVFVAIGAVVMWLWNNVVHPAFQAIGLVFHWVGEVAQWLWDHAIGPAIHAIAAAANWLWKNAIYPAGQAIGLVFHVVGEAASWLWNNAINPAIQAIAGVFKWLWDTGEHWFNLIMDKVRAVGGVFSSIFGAIGGFISNAFNGAVNIIKGVINDIISLLNSAINFINNDMIDTANKLPGVNFPHIPHIPYLYAGGTVMQSGAAVVGDRGPELVTLPTGATVTPLTGNHASGKRGGGGAVSMNFKGNVDAALAQIIHKLIRGGDIQIEVDGVPVTVS